MVIYIPIGIDCGVSDTLKELNIREKAYPFDHIVSYNGICEIIKNDFKDFLPDLNKETVIIGNDNKPNVFNSKYGLKFIHDDLYKQEEIDKYNRRIDRFKELLKREDNELIVFIRKGHAYHNHNEFKFKNELLDTIELDNYLKETYPKLNYKIIVILLCYNCYKLTAYKDISKNIEIHYSLITDIRDDEWTNKCITGHIYKNYFTHIYKKMIII